MTEIDYYIAQFNLYRLTHPNLVDCWLSYLGLKKRHYDATAADFTQCQYVLQQMSDGHEDFERDNLIRLTLYAMSI
jgi:hypothetical protein